MARYRKPEQRKKTARPKRKLTRATQVTGKDIDKEFEDICDNPKAKVDTYNENIVRRKRAKYPKLFCGAKIPRYNTHYTVPKKESYHFWPIIKENKPK